MISSEVLKAEHQARQRALDEQHVAKIRAQDEVHRERRELQKQAMMWARWLGTEPARRAARRPTITRSVPHA